jgi:hypothetical protein
MRNHPCQSGVGRVSRRSEWWGTRSDRLIRLTRGPRVRDDQRRCKVRATVFPSHSVSFIVWWTIKHCKTRFSVCPYCQGTAYFVNGLLGNTRIWETLKNVTPALTASRHSTTFPTNQKNPYNIMALLDLRMHGHRLDINPFSFHCCPKQYVSPAARLRFYPRPILSTE